MQFTRFASLRPLAASLVLVLSACGGGGIDGIPASSGTAAETSSFSVGGSASGLESGNPVTLQNNGADDLSVSADGNFAFATAVTGPYAVTIGQQPLWQDCTVANGSGTATADVTGVSVSCAPYTAYVSTVAGTAAAGTSVDGTGPAASFSYPAGMAIDASGNVYVHDYFNGLRRITTAGVVTTIASGLGGGYGLAIGPDGNFYVSSDELDQIFKVTPDGTVTTFAGSGAAADADGNGTSASFYYPSGLAFDRAGNLYVSELSGSIRKITPAGDVSTLPGTGGFYAYSLVVDDAGVVYVADFGDVTIRKILPDGTVSVLAGIPGSSGTTDGPAASATFQAPLGIALGRDGAIYVSDYGAQTIRRISASGVVSTIAGTAGAYGSTDGAATTVATLGGPFGMAFDAAGTLWFADYLSGLVRRLGRP
jgi:sugar lactone lactonase YvrE